MVTDVVASALGDYTDTVSTSTLIETRQNINHLICYSTENLVRKSTYVAKEPGTQPKHHRFTSEEAAGGMEGAADAPQIR